MEEEGGRGRGTHIRGKSGNKKGINPLTPPLKTNKKTPRKAERWCLTDAAQSVEVVVRHHSSNYY